MHDINTKKNDILFVFIVSVCLQNRETKKTFSKISTDWLKLITTSLSFLVCSEWWNRGVIRTILWIMLKPYEVEGKSSKKPTTGLILAKLEILERTWKPQGKIPLIIWITHIAELHDDNEYKMLLSRVTVCCMMNIICIIFLPFPIDP